MSNKIILIEDEVFIHDIYKLILEKNGFDVISAYDGELGLQLIKNNPDVALVFLDIMLPKMHGIDVLRIAKSDTAVQHIPIVLLSNLGDDDIIAETMKLGARDYLKKVYITPKLLAVCAEQYLKDPSYKFDYNKVQ